MPLCIQMTDSEHAINISISVDCIVMKIFIPTQSASFECAVATPNSLIVKGFMSSFKSSLGNLGILLVSVYPFRHAIPTYFISQAVIYVACNRPCHKRLLYCYMWRKTHEDNEQFDNYYTCKMRSQNMTNNNKTLKMTFSFSFSFGISLTV